MSDQLSILTLVLAGFAAGILASFVIRWVQSRSNEKVINQILKNSEVIQQENFNLAIGNLKESFSSLSFEALTKSNDELLKVAKTQLGSERELATQELQNKKEKIDDQMIRMHTDLNKVTELIKDIEKDRVNKFSELTNTLKATNEQTSHLIHSTNSLKEVLGNSQTRGQWGERIAEDVLNMSGFVENISYKKQLTLKNGSRPDFTFLLPKEFNLNMDVKFPISNYIRMVEASHKEEKEIAKKDFFRDVKNRIREVKSRGYISQKEGTVDCVILFIPNEQVFSYIQQENPELFDFATQHKIICCSPLTLFAVLAVIRQAVENFSLEKTSNEILEHMTKFKAQWIKYLDKFDLLGKKIHDAQNEYDLLASTRTRLLDNSIEKLNKISKLQEDDS